MLSKPSLPLSKKNSDWLIAWLVAWLCKHRSTPLSWIGWKTFDSHSLTFKWITEQCSTVMDVNIPVFDPSSFHSTYTFMDSLKFRFRGNFFVCFPLHSSLVSQLLYKNLTRRHYACSNQNVWMFCHSWHQWLIYSLPVTQIVTTTS